MTAPTRFLLTLLPHEVLNLIIQFAVSSREDTTVLEHVCKSLAIIANAASTIRTPPLKVKVFVDSIPRLQWTKEMGYTKWHERTCALVAEGGNLEVLKWLHIDVGCPWDRWTTNFAARGGHLEVLKWLREAECPSNYWACAFAAQAGHRGVVKWLSSVPDHQI